MAAVFSLAQVAYCGLFAILALFMRRSLLIGVVYIILFEGLLASFDTIARRMTVMYYFRVLVLRSLAPASGSEWKFDLKTAHKFRDLRVDPAWRGPDPDHPRLAGLCHPRVPHEDARG